MINMSKMKSLNKIKKHKFIIVIMFLKVGVIEENLNNFKEIEIQIIKFLWKQVDTNMLNKIIKA